MFIPTVFQQKISLCKDVLLESEDNDFIINRKKDKETEIMYLRILKKLAELLDIIVDITRTRSTTLNYINISPYSIRSSY